MITLTGWRAIVTLVKPVNVTVAEMVDVANALADTEGIIRAKVSTNEGRHKLYVTLHSNLPHDDLRLLVARAAKDFVREPFKTQLTRLDTPVVLS